MRKNRRLSFSFLKYREVFIAQRYPDTSWFMFSSRRHGVISLRFKEGFGMSELSILLTAAREQWLDIGSHS